MAIEPQQVDRGSLPLFLLENTEFDPSAARRYLYPDRIGKVIDLGQRRKLLTIFRNQHL